MTESRLKTMRGVFQQNWSCNRGAVHSFQTFQNWQDVFIYAERTELPRWWIEVRLSRNRLQRRGWYKNRVARSRQIATLQFDWATEQPRHDTGSFSTTIFKPAFVYRTNGRLAALPVNGGFHSERKSKGRIYSESRQLITPSHHETKHPFGARLRAECSALAI